MSSLRTAQAERDYDTLRPGPGGDPEVDSLEQLQEARTARRAALGERELGDDDGFHLPTADLLDEGELEMVVVPMQAGEFRCACCFLVLGRHLLAAGSAGVCRDCT